MKQIYAKEILFLLLLCALVCLSGKTSAQCMCSAGIAPKVVSYYVTVGPTNLPTSYFSFPQFDPATGTLTCVSLLDTISGITTTGVRNLNSVPSTYQFQLVVSNNITGPGALGSGQSFSTVYGPNTLEAYGNPGDTLTYGPDPLFTNSVDSNNTTDVAPYYGHGTVDFSWALNGGLVTLLGGLNYRSQIVTTYSGSFRLNYYWCPSSILASSINSFSAEKTGDDVLLQWKDGNEQAGNSYEVQYSRDGVHFTALTTTNASSSAGSVHRYKYRIATAEAERLYFRIKKNDGSGKSGYSVVKTVVVAGSGQMVFSVYPNPAAGHVTIESSELLSGTVRVSIVNTVGQAVYGRVFPANSAAASIGVDLPPGLGKGLYYMQISNPGRNVRQLIKIFVQ